MMQKIILKGRYNYGKEAWQSTEGHRREVPHRQDACIPMRVRYAADIDLSMAAKSQERDPEQRCADKG